MHSGVGEGSGSTSDHTLVSGGPETSSQAMLENGYASGFMPAQQLGQYLAASVMVGDENQPPYGIEFDPPVSENWSVFQPLPQGVTMFVPFAEIDPTSSEPGQLFEQPEGYAAMDVAQYEPENTEEEPVSSIVSQPSSSSAFMADRRVDPTGLGGS